jgi:type 1 fimbria pilin
MSRNVIGLIGALLLAGTAFAAGANSGNLHLDKAVTVQGKQLESGEYRVRWNATGDTVQLNITDEKRNVTTVTAHVVAVGSKNESDGHVTRDENGSTTLTQISFRGKNYELHLDDQVAAIPESSGDSSNK